MLLKKLAGVALVGLMLVMVGCTKNSEIQAERQRPAVAPQPAAGNEVAFPKLPKGAGQIDEKAPKVFSTTESGLMYRVLREGPGAKPNASQSVEVNYHGWLDNEKVFDSSYKRGESISFPLGGVIPGWTEGMQLVGEGGMIELQIPADLGYGSGGTQGIPPNATLHFIVELIDVQ